MAGWLGEGGSGRLDEEISLCVLADGGTREGSATVDT